MTWGGVFEDNDNDNKSFETIPRGAYACTLENAVLEQSSEKKTDFLSLTTVIKDGEFAGRKLWCKLWFTDGAKGMTSMQLSKLLVFDKIQPTSAHETVVIKNADGENVKAFKNMSDFMNMAADRVFKLVGKTIEVTVTKHREYNGKTYEETLVTGYLDTPNEAIQTVKADTMSMGPAPTFDSNEEIPF